MTVKKLFLPPIFFGWALASTPIAGLAKTHPQYNTKQHFTSFQIDPRFKIECKLSAFQEFHMGGNVFGSRGFWQTLYLVAESVLPFSSGTKERIGSTTYFTITGTNKTPIRVEEQTGLARTPHMALTEAFASLFQLKMMASRQSRSTAYKVHYLGFKYPSRISLKNWQLLYTLLTGWSDPPLQQAEISTDRGEPEADYFSLYRAEYNGVRNNSIFALIFPQSLPPFERMALHLQNCHGEFLNETSQTKVYLNDQELLFPSDWID